MRTLSKSDHEYHPDLPLNDSFRHFDGSHGEVIYPGSKTKKECNLNFLEDLDESYATDLVGDVF
jgi:hypothetical protein